MSSKKLLLKNNGSDIRSEQEQAGGFPVHRGLRSWRAAIAMMTAATKAKVYGSQAKTTSAKVTRWPLRGRA